MLRFENAIRLVLLSCLQPLLLSPECSRGIQLLGNPLRRLASSGYWLLKVELCELIRQIPFKAVYYATGKIEVQRKLKDLLMNYVDVSWFRKMSKVTFSVSLYCLRHLFFRMKTGAFGQSLPSHCLLSVPTSSIRKMTRTVITATPSSRQPTRWPRICWIRSCGTDKSRSG